jgi:hypothetical protein
MKSIKTPVPDKGSNVELKSTATAVVGKTVRAKDSFTDFLRQSELTFTKNKAMRNHKELMAVRADDVF